MRIIAILGGGAFVVVSLVVGGRMLLLARRTRGLPELVLGLCLFLMGGLGYPLTAVARQAMALDVGVRTGFMIVAHLCILFGAGSLGVFNWRVFRPESDAARAACFALAAALAGCFVWQGVTPGFAAGAVGKEGAAIVAINLLTAVAMLWSGVESALHLQRLLRRQRLGIGDAVVTDRIRLWCFSMTGAAAIAVASTVLHFLGLDPAASVAGALIIGPVGLASSIATWLAFLPPARYRARLEARRRAPA
ncbi:MAG TPA: hypothetical protein VNE71_03565 [Myxococcota bacterium]|nr:hypothetical protein [Myxococcota bacterium]